jgi:polygalacturonase
LTLQVDGTLQAIEATPQVLNTTWPKLPPLVIYNSSEDFGRIPQYQAFLYAKNVTNLRITGTGVIDGHGEAWWNAFTNHSALLQAGRPNLIQIVNSRNIEIDSVTLKDSPFWTLHPVLSQDIHIHHVKIRSRLYAPNVDGIDPDSCRNVLIEYNDVSCGDDHVAIKAGRCGDSITPNKCTDPIWKSGMYQTTNVTVRYNVFKTGMGIAIGSESSGSIRNVHVHDNVIGLASLVTMVSAVVDGDQHFT